MPFLLFFLALSNGAATSILRIHNADSLKAKCDALPYRTHFEDGRCYFAIGKELILERANEECSATFPGAKLIAPVKSVILKFFLEISDFHHPAEKGERKKQTLCLYESIIECDSGDQPQLPGAKCAIRAEKKMNFAEASKHCASQSAVLASIANSKEQQSIFGIIRSNPVWVDATLGKKGWSDKNGYKWLTTCKAWNLTSPNELTTTCKSDLALVAMPKGEAMTYSSLSDQTNLMDVVCLRDASTPFFTASKIKPICTIPEKFCEEEHTYDPTTKQCEWTGPKDACMKLIKHDNQSFYMTNPTGASTDMELKHDTDKAWKVVRSVVRRGCRATGWALGWVVLMNNGQYGAQTIPNFYAGTAAKIEDGLSYLRCECKSPPSHQKTIEKPASAADKDCIAKFPPDYCAPDHRVDPATGECEWTGPKDSCVRLVHFDNRTTFVNMNPTRKAGSLERIDSHTVLENYLYNDVLAQDFNEKVTKIVVRRGCIISVGASQDKPWQLVPDVTYGEHTVPNFYSGTVNKHEDGPTQINCFCYPPMKHLEPEPEPTPCTIETKFCEEEHTYNPASMECEWTGPKDACMKLIQHDNQSWYMTNPLGTWGQIDMELYNIPEKVRKVVKSVVRRGCRATGWAYGWKLLMDNGQYGYQTIPNFYAGTAARVEDGLSYLRCSCDPPLGFIEPPPKPAGCIEKRRLDFCAEDHRIDPTTGECEWTGPKEACAKLYDPDNNTMYAYIPKQTGSLVRQDLMNPVYGTPFEYKVVKLVVRRGCIVATGTRGQGSNVLTDRTYGVHEVKSYYAKQPTLNSPHHGTQGVSCYCYPPMKNLEPESVKNR